MTKKGNYLLLLFIEKEEKIQVGKLGNFVFQKGWYCYVGSAMNNLEARIARHLKKEKKLRWHIDYLRTHAGEVEVISLETSVNQECQLNKLVAFKADVTPIRKFGSSDCGCFSHLHFFHKKPYSLLKELINQSINADDKRTTRL